MAGRTAGRRDLAVRGHAAWRALARAARAARGLLALLGATLAAPALAISIDLQLLPGATGLSAPVAVVDAGDGSGRLFIVEQGGRIRIWRDGAIVAADFLTIPAASIVASGELGLLGLAFHPDFANNGYFFVNYTENEPTDPPSCPPGAGCDQNTVIARFRVQSKVDPVNGSPDLADYATEVRLLKFNQPYSNHNGGDLHFGPDGYLYISTGDGGNGGDPHDFGQSVSTLLGKILRIDVDATPPPGNGLCGISPQAYAAAPGNAFLGAQVPGCDEIWHLGLRNPFRFSFDRSNGDLFIGDVGQSAHEEIDFQPAGAQGAANWGWRCYEGNFAYNGAGCGDISNYLFPIHDYGHSSGRCSVAGGFRYRGSIYHYLAGAYLFGDYCTGEIWSLSQVNGVWSVAGPHYNAPFNISSFGEDGAGELYVVAYNAGAIYRLQETSVPSLLDADDNGAPLPYSDGVLMLRWLFGLGGDALTAGAVGDNCHRCSALEITSYLDSISEQLDIDGNQSTQALTDGVLLLRWLLDLHADALTAGAVASDCTRCDAGDIETYLGGL